MGYSPWGHKESGTTEQPSTHLSREDTSAAPDGHLQSTANILRGFLGCKAGAPVGALAPGSQVLPTGGVHTSTKRVPRVHTAPLARHEA